MKQTKRASGIILDILIVAVIIISIIVTIITLTTNKDGIPSLKGYSPFSIQSNSMYPNLKKGDEIIVKKIDIVDIKEGDIISFFDTINGENVIVTHRVVKVDYIDNNYFFTTKGDNNSFEDDKLITYEDLVGVYTGIRIPKVGYIIDFLRSKIGFLLFIVLPLLVLFIFQMKDLISLLVSKEINEAKK